MTLKPDELEQCRKLLDEGYSYKAVSRATGRAVSTLQKYFPGRGMSKSDAGRASRLSWESNKTYRRLGMH